MKRQTRFTNMYYSQYDNSVENEYPFFDSDNPDTYERLMHSPSQSEFNKYIDHRREEELMHEHWKLTLREDVTLAKEIEEKCGVLVSLGDNCVRYVYKPDIDDTPIPGIKFKLVLKYVKLLRKWYISPGYSRLPEVINLDDKISAGTYDPVGAQIIKLVRKVRRLLEIYVNRLIFIFRVMGKVKGTYKDIEFQVNPHLTKVKIMLKEKGWPRNLEKTCPNDIIVLELTLNGDLEVENIDYEYVHRSKLSKVIKQKCLSKLDEKVQVFFDLPLMEAFEIFMNNEISIGNESFQEGNTS